MKKILFLVVMIASISGVWAQGNVKKEGAVITFEKRTHDFGTINPGDKVEHVFAFTNTGTEPLIITNVQVTCGCTAPKWPRDPIMPGGKGEITIAFNSAGKSDRQDKVVTVVSNAVNPEEAKISFTAFIQAKQPQ